MSIYFILNISISMNEKIEGKVLDLTNVSWDEIHIAPVVSQTTIKNISPPTLEDVCMKLNMLEKSCSDCGGSVFYSLRVWKASRLCYSCHSIRHKSLLIEVEQYMIEKDNTKCVFCEKPRNNPHDFHLDHVNMYSKKGSVGQMIYYGESIDIIKAEIDKCQLLCISCHAAVTHFEHKYGFIKTKNKKHKHTKQYNMSIYDEYMEVVYSALRGWGKI